MSRNELSSLIDEAFLTLDELCRVGAVDPDWVRDRVEAGLLAAASQASDPWQFEPRVIERVRCMIRLERDFDAVPELAALVADLEHEIRHLRARLRAAGVG
jgi:chaperone modulatory protein CbpM